MQEVVTNLEKFSNKLQNRRYCENDVIFWKTMHYVCFITFYKDCDKRNIEVIKYSVNLNPKRIYIMKLKKVYSQRSSIFISMDASVSFTYAVHILLGLWRSFSPPC